MGNVIACVYQQLHHQLHHPRLVEEFVVQPDNIQSPALSAMRALQMVKADHQQEKMLHQVYCELIRSYVVCHEGASLA